MTTQLPVRPFDTEDLRPLAMSEAERDRAIRHSLRRAETYDTAQPVIAHVERLATRAPDAIAVCDRHEAVGYAELARRARHVAGFLTRANIGAGDVVAIGGERGAGIVTAFLATELVGAVYLPVESSWPAKRTGGVLADSGARVLLATDPEAGDLAAGAGLAGCPVEPLPRGDSPDFAEPARLSAPDQVRYVLYTSGSTGKPKGAVVEHLGMLNHLWAKVTDLGIGPDDRLAQTAPLGFDISVWQMLAPLLVGGEVVVVPDDAAHDARALLDVVRQRRVTVLEVVPTLIRLMLDTSAGAQPSDLGGLRWLLATGEALPPTTAGRWLRMFPDVGLLNAYGPTECSDDVTHHRVEPVDVDGAHLPIGGPVGNAVLYVLRRDDESGTWSACEPGEVGELFVGGPVVGRGYLGDPDRTRDTFFVDTLAGAGRLYRTGDAVRRQRDRPVLEYLGRVDRQVKVAGVRMELPEIEAVLRRAPGVVDCAVVARKPDARALVARRTALSTEEGAARLVAYVTTGDTPLDWPAVREHLADRLPLPMVPALCVELPNLPLTRNGKIDYAALPAPVEQPRSGSGGAAPTDPREQVIADVLGELLAVGEVGRDDSFTALGGDSLLAMRVVAQLRSHGFAVSLRDVLMAGSPRELAAVAESVTPESSAPAPVPEASPEPRVRPLTPQQEGLYFHWRLEPDNAYYHYQGTLSLAGPLDAGRLAAAWAALMLENPVLLARFVRREGELRHEYPHWTVPFPEFEDLSAMTPAAADEHYHDEAFTEASLPFDLENEPVFRMRAFVMSDREHRILVTTHEVMLDGWGATVLYRRLAELYGQSEPAPDPAQRDRYDRYLDWQEAALASPAVAASGEHWRRELAGELPVLALDDRPRPQHLSYRAGMVERVIDAGVMRRIRALSARDGRTPFPYLLTAYAIALCFYTNDDEVVIGAPIANRANPEQVDIASFLLNMLPFRIPVGPDTTAGELLDQVSEQVVAGIAASNYPFGWVQRDLPPAPRGSANTAVFQTMLNMITYPAHRVIEGELEFTFTELDTGYAKYDCELYVQHHGTDELLAQFLHQTDIISEQTANRLLDSTLLALDVVVFAPHLPVVEIDLLSATDRDALHLFAQGS